MKHTIKHTTKPTMKPRSERPRTKPAHTPGSATVSKPTAKPRRTKPVFEVPQEPVQPSASEWVYRTDPAPAPPAKHAAAPPRQAQTRTHAAEMPSVLIVAGVGMLVAGIAAVSLVSLAAMGMVGAPVMLFRGLFWRSGN